MSRQSLQSIVWWAHALFPLPGNVFPRVGLFLQLDAKTRGAELKQLACSH